jgi:hypothetical protein
MTPFTRFLMKQLPQRAVKPVLTITYLGTFLAVILLIGRITDNMLYLDIARGQ